MADPDPTTTLSLHDDSDSEPRMSELLYLVLEAAHPLRPSTRHLLDFTDEVEIARGPRGAERLPVKNRSRLVIHVEDHALSAPGPHAVLRRRDKAWVAFDHGSKNGLLVNGKRCDHATLSDGDLIEVGRTFFLYRTSPCIDERTDLESSAVDSTGGIGSWAPAMVQPLRVIAGVATSKVPILILGPTGSGKELAARGAHAASARSGRFVAINCAAIPENLVASMLFGTRRGGFSGAIDKPGAFEEADGGTLFLDEIGDLPITIQPALLRALQEGEVTPVGATRPISVDVRVVAATHRDLDDLIARQQFRDDLMARLRGAVVELPALAERVEDLGMLIAALLRRVDPSPVDRRALHHVAARAMLAYPWPRNVRELEQCLGRASAMARDHGEPRPIKLDDLPIEVRGDRKPEWTGADQDKRDRLIELLRQYDGNVTRVGEVLGKRRQTVQRWLKRFAIRREELVE